MGELTDAEWKPFAAALGIEPIDTCPMCDEPVMDGDDVSPTPLHTPEGARTPHRSCMLREVTGGIGHLIAHDYWCAKPRMDPDAGLTRRQSALLVDLYIRLVGVEKAVGNG